MITKMLMLNTLKDSAFCVVEENKNGIKCIKNRFGNITMDDCKEYDFEKVKLSELNGTILDISKTYYGKNIWLLLEE